MVEHDIELAVDKGARACGPAVVARVGDVGTQTVTARLTRDSQPYSPSGVSARLEVLKADGTWCRCDAQLSGDEVTCVLPSQALSSPGVARLAYFVLFSGDEAESTESFELRVLPHVDSSGPESENYDDQLTQLYNEYVAKLGGLDEQYEQAEQQRDSQYSSAEASRNQSFQQAQAQRQTDYEQAEAARDAAQGENDAKQEANDSAQASNDSAQAKNNADQQLNNQMAQGLQVVILSSGQYDPGTLEPTVSGEAGKLYFVPAGSGDDEDAYVEWMWVGSAWERVGMSNATIEAVSTDQIDSVVADGAPQGEQVLNLTGLSYLWAKLKAAFSAIGHKHSATDVTSGTLPIARGGTGTASLSSEAGNGGFVAASRGNPTLFAETGTGAAYADKDGTHVGTLPVSLGGTGSTSASAALTSLGAASASDLQSVRDSLSQCIRYYTGNGAVDLNDLTENGLFSYNNPANRPNGTDGWVNLLVIQMNNNSNYVSQLAMCNIGVYYRFRMSGNWYAWVGL